jgi:hypothetical protein
MKNEIYNQIVDSIEDAHIKAELSTKSAREAMMIAIDDRTLCAALVEKGKQICRHDLALMLSNIMNPEQVKAYLSLHDAATKRPAMYDKRQLLLMGILEAGEPPKRSGIKSRPDLITFTRRYIGNIQKQMSQVPLEDWTENEKEQAREMMGPVIEFYNKL